MLLFSFCFFDSLGHISLILEVNAELVVWFVYHFRVFALAVFGFKDCGSAFGFHEFVENSGAVISIDNPSSVLQHLRSSKLTFDTPSCSPGSNFPRVTFPLVTCIIWQNFEQEGIFKSRKRGTLLSTLAFLVIVETIASEDDDRVLGDVKDRWTESGREEFISHSDLLPLGGRRNFLVFIYFIKLGDKACQRLKLDIFLLDFVGEFEALNCIGAICALTFFSVVFHCHTGKNIDVLLCEATATVPVTTSCHVSSQVPLRDTWFMFAIDVENLCAASHSPEFLLRVWVLCKAKHI